LLSTLSLIERSLGSLQIRKERVVNKVLT
jgi:hypothetical protein